MRAIDLLRQFADDLGSRGIREIRQLTQVVVGGAPRARTLEGRAHEERAFHWRRDDDRFAAYLRFLVLNSLICQCPSS